MAWLAHAKMSAVMSMRKESRSPVFHLQNEFDDDNGRGER
jgi:hypothetical protein